MNRRSLLVAGACLMALGFAPSIASAQCAFEHPKKTARLHAGLVQAFVSCNNPGGNVPNSTTEGGVPSCKLPETFHQQAGSPNGGWLWDEERSTGFVQFTPVKVSAPNTADLRVRLVLRKILNQNGLANGNGTLATVARATIDDRMNGDMTIVDFPAGFAFAMINGNATLKTSANTLLQGIGQPPLPYCSSIEVVSVLVLDPNGNAFANIGTYLPRPW
jgi:hypothetical protein